MESLARLQNSPYPPRKMRLLADLVRGMRADKAVYVLDLHEKKMYSKALGKLLRSAIANWQAKNDTGADVSGLIVKEIRVDKARMLKRVQPAPQGRAHRIRKRFNHITIVVDNGMAVSAPKTAAPKKTAQVEK
ncbi:MAG: 50S ribosomal protein L22 [Bacteroidota bacterium]|nr:50S ribosomal protein L22 [Bacteroidota bacterium]